MSARVCETWRTLADRRDPVGNADPVEFVLAAVDEALGYVRACAAGLGQEHHRQPSGAREALDWCRVNGDRFWDYVPGLMLLGQLLLREAARGVISAAERLLIEVAEEST